LEVDPVDPVDPVETREETREDALLVCAKVSVRAKKHINPPSDDVAGVWECMQQSALQSTPDRSCVCSLSRTYARSSGLEAASAATSTVLEAASEATSTVPEAASEAASEAVP
jgi:hypothetical protein